MFGVLGMPLDGSARPRKPSPPRGANGIFRQNFGQCIRELLIEYGNVPASRCLVGTLEPLRPWHISAVFTAWSFAFSLRRAMKKARDFSRAFALDNKRTVRSPSRPCRHPALPKPRGLDVRSYKADIDWPLWSIRSVRSMHISPLDGSHRRPSSVQGQSKECLAHAVPGAGDHGSRIFEPVEGPRRQRASKRKLALQRAEQRRAWQVSAVAQGPGRLTTDKTIVPADHNSRQT